ncbi:DUF1120 domain-containing protein, partial [Pseudomonas fluorescens]
MKKYLAAISATALISVAPFALAASSTELTVTGFITPSACEMSLSSGGIIDVGDLQMKDLNPTTFTLVNATPLELAVACDAPALFAINAIDNNPGTSWNGSGYGLGLVGDDIKLGGFTPAITRVTADGVSARAIQSVDGTGWTATPGLFPAMLTSTAALGTLEPIPVENLQMNL